MSTFLLMKSGAKIYVNTLVIFNVHYFVGEIYYIMHLLKCLADKTDILPCKNMIQVVCSGIAPGNDVDLVI